MDVGSLISFLAPCLGFLLDKGRTATDRAAEKLGDEAWDHARRLWARLGPAVDARPAAAEAAADLAARPDDEGARSALAWQLDKALGADLALAQDLERLWEAAARRAVVARGDGSVAVGGDIVGSTVVTGSRNVLGGRS
jgi:hypothetical protein